MTTPIAIYPATHMVYKRNPWTGGAVYHMPKVEVHHPYHHFTKYKGDESEAEYVQRVATAKRRADFADERRYSRFAMGTPAAWNYEPTPQDYDFARGCWAKVLAAMATPLDELMD
jgi:hypothetical protein